MRTRVKICGLTNLEDAIAAAAVGADLLGFVFADSPRQASPLVVERIVAALPPLVQTVGVFVDAEPREMLRTAVRCRLDYVQLHGSESPADCLVLGDIPVIKAVRVGRDDPRKIFAVYGEVARLLLFDTNVAGMDGGTGMTFAWEVLDDLPPGCRYVLAGGLTPANVGRAIRRCRPWVVDVSSGVEAYAGKKDIEKMTAFMAAVRKADEEF
ncbi:MAG: phosphoribosylanthranilate isomerase [Deltaproteobacteria bacterium]|nr:phosphoribosylanthranilate isomerase [Candidatus Anaeroferrophillacea bacterium]